MTKEKRLGIDEGGYSIFRSNGRSLWVHVYGCFQRKLWRLAILVIMTIKHMTIH